MPPAQGSFSTPPISDAASHPRYFGSQDIYILEEASSILQYPLQQLIRLDRASRQIQQPSPSTPYRVPFKRPRFSTDPVAMSPRSSSMPRPSSQEVSEYHHRVGDTDGGFSFTQCFANFCSPCAAYDPPGWYPSYVADASASSTSAKLG